MFCSIMFSALISGLFRFCNVLFYFCLGQFGSVLFVSMGRCGGFGGVFFFGGGFWGGGVSSLGSVKKGFL